MLLYFLFHMFKGTYLGITITGTMSWSKHISVCGKKANSQMCFLGRNLKGSLRPLKRTSFVTLGRSLGEYGSVACEPYLGKNKDTLEHIQCRAAHWINQDFATTLSLMEMLGALGLETLTDHRRSARLTMMYKTPHHYVGLTPEEVSLQVLSCRSRALHSWKLFHHCTRTEELRDSFSAHAILEWNSLPARLTDADSLDIFQSQLTWYMTD